MSARSNFNFEKPFLWLARRMCGNKDLQFTAEVAKAPVVQIDAEQIRQLNLEAEAAKNIAIDDDDEDL